MVYLKHLERKGSHWPDETFPFSLPVIHHLQRIEFCSPVTFFVGENGSGKSTVLEAIAVGMRMVSVGSDDVERDNTLDHVRKLADQITFARSRNPKRGFFFRAEDFFGFTRRITQTIAEMEEIALPGALAERQALTSRYGANPDARSHGENFMHVLQSRVVPGGLYLLDEPETPLSPLRQLALVALLKDMIEQDCQFIIATHSPILMALPGATILNMDAQPIDSVEWDDIEHVRLMRSFLNDPEAFLRRL